MRSWRVTFLPRSCTETPPRPECRRANTPVSTSTDRSEAEMKQDEAPNKPKRRLRRILTPIIVALAILVFTATVPAAWARRTALNTDRFVELVGPLADDPAIQQVAGRQGHRTDHVPDRRRGRRDRSLPGTRGRAGGSVDERDPGIRAQPRPAGVRERRSSRGSGPRRTDSSTRRCSRCSTEGSDTVSTVGGKVALNLMPMVQARAGADGGLGARPHRPQHHDPRDRRLHGTWRGGDASGVRVRDRSSRRFRHGRRVRRRGARSAAEGGADLRQGS